MSSPASAEKSHPQHQQQPESHPRRSVPIVVMAEEVVTDNDDQVFAIQHVASPMHPGLSVSKTETAPAGTSSKTAAIVEENVFAIQGPKAANPAKQNEMTKGAKENGAVSKQDLVEALDKLQSSKTGTQPRETMPGPSKTTKEVYDKAVVNLVNAMDKLPSNKTVPQETTRQTMQRKPLDASKTARTAPKTSPLKMFKARPAPNPPKPKEIAFSPNTGTLSGVGGSNSPISPLGGGEGHPPKVVSTGHPSSKANPLSPMADSPLHPRLWSPHKQVEE